MKTPVKSGVTTVEVLISLLIMSIFLFSGYQLYSVVLSGSLLSRSRSKAANIAYSHLRYVGDSINMANCSTDVITANRTPMSDENLPGLTIKSTVSAPYSCAARLMRVEIEVSYNVGTTKHKEVQAVYVQK